MKSKTSGKKSKKPKSLIDYKVLYGVVKNFTSKQGNNLCSVQDTEEIKELYRKAMSMLFPVESYAWKEAIRWMIKENIITLSCEKKKTVHSNKKEPYGYIDIGKVRIYIKDGWKEKLSEVIKNRSLMNRTAQRTPEQKKAWIRKKKAKWYYEKKKARKTA